VLKILEQRAADELSYLPSASRGNGTASFTEISDAISVEINAHYAKLFEFFQARPELCLQPLYRRALLAHLPRMIRESPTFGCGSEPPTQVSRAMLAVEIASSIVYRGGFERHFEEDLRDYVVRIFA